MKITTRYQLPLLLNDWNLVYKAVEVGVCRGEFAHKFIKAWKGREYYLVDIWQSFPREYYLNYHYIPIPTNTQQQLHFIETISGFEEQDWPRIRFLQISSVEASRFFEEESLDFVYIDAMHDFGSVVQDIKSWYPKMKKGAILAGHDYELDSVKQAVAATLKEPVTVIEEDVPSWYVIVGSVKP